ncbi:hypothetical protein AGLY_009897 [Aphis glycines]|uniref:Uncharacterized protein n=1 Tax=Aphis glycines TaxID=307491 RepID=A0A6G0TI08_APHGL|nr:hypothetical protein AGLY_009897 [Aphis glycines]
MKSCKENANLNNWINRYLSRKIYGEPCTKFSKLSYKRKIFTIFQPQNYLQIFAILTYFIFWSAKKFLSLFKKKYLEKLKISIFLSYSKIKNSILTKTGFAGAEVKNRSIFTAPNVVDKHKEKQKKKTHIIVKSIHLSLCSKSKKMGGEKGGLCFNGLNTPKFKYKYKHFYKFSTTKLLVNFRDFDIFRKNLNFERLYIMLYNEFFLITIRTAYEKSCIKLLSFFGHPKYFYRHLKKKLKAKIF